MNAQPPIPHKYLSPPPPPMTLSALERAVVAGWPIYARSHYEDHVCKGEYCEGKPLELAEADAFVATLNTFGNLTS